MRIAITGSSGYLGSRLVARLSRDPDVEAIVGIDLRPPPDPPAKLHFHERDITAMFADVFEDELIDTAVHLAFVVGPSRDEAGVRRVNVGGTKRFLEACRARGVGHVVYLSSTAAYGAWADNPVPLTEGSPLRPNEDFQYSRDKAETDRLFQGFGEVTADACVTIIRGCPVIGPGGHGAVGARVFQPVMVRIAGHDPPMQFLHEDDVVRMLVHVVKERTGGIFNAAGDGLVRYSQLARLAHKPMVVLPRQILAPLMQAAWRARIQSSSPATGLNYITHSWVAANGRFVEVTGFSYCHSSEEAVRLMVGR